MKGDTTNSLSLIRSELRTKYWQENHELLSEEDLLYEIMCVLQ